MKKSQLITVIIVGVAVLLALNLFYFFHFNWNLSDKPSDFSHYGSFIGGALGAIFSFITIIILLVTLKLQSDQADSQLENQKKTNDETIKLLRSQLNQSIESYNIEYKYNHIIQQVENIDKILNYVISGKQKALIYRDNNIKIDNRFDITLSDFIIILKDNKIDFYKIKFNNNIDFLIEHNMRYLEIEIAALCRYLSSLSCHKFEYLFLFDKLLNVYNINKYLYEINYYSNLISYYFLESLSNTKINEFTFLIHNIKEVRKIIFDKLKLEKKIDRSIGFNDFLIDYDVKPYNGYQNYIVSKENKTIGVVKIFDDEFEDLERLVPLFYDEEVNNIK